MPYNSSVLLLFFFRLFDLSDRKALTVTGTNHSSGYHPNPVQVEMILRFQWSSGFEWRGFKRVPRKPLPVLHPNPLRILEVLYLLNRSNWGGDLQGSVTVFSICGGGGGLVAVLRFELGRLFFHLHPSVLSGTTRGFHCGPTSDLMSESLFLAPSATSGPRGRTSTALSGRQCWIMEQN